MDKPKRKQCRKYETAEERKKGIQEAQKRYGKKTWTCEICDITMTRKNKTNHLRTIKHQRKACPTCSESED
jgi:rubrerythrin